MDPGGYERLEVWKIGCDLSVRLYSALKNCKDFGLRDQMQRAVISIPSNIAEGAERGSTAEYRNFLCYAKGSAAELRTQIHIACRIGILSEQDGEAFMEELTRLSRMLEGIRRTLENKLHDSSQPSGCR